MAHGNARAGKHKARYDKYKNQGRLEINKKRKQEKAKKREERFAQRRADGKNYVYPQNEVPTINVVNKRDPAYLESVFRKLDNELAAEKLAMKERLNKPRRKKNGKQVQKTS